MWLLADPSGRAVKGVDLRSLACWECWFESHRGHGCLSLASGVCCQVETSTSGLSLVQRSHTECDVSECDSEAPQGEAMTRNRVEAPQEKILIIFIFI